MWIPSLNRGTDLGILHDGRSIKIDLSGLTWLQALRRRSGLSLGGYNQARSLINACPSRHGVTIMEVIKMPESIHSQSEDVVRRRLQIQCSDVDQRLQYVQ